MTTVGPKFGLTNSEGKPSLADATNAHNGDQSVQQQKRANMGNFVVPPDYWCWPVGQIRGVLLYGPQGRKQGPPYLEEMYWVRHVSQVMKAEVDQFGCLIRGRLFRRSTEKDLSTVTCVLYSGRHVYVWTEVVPVPFLGAADMHTDTHPQSRAGPRHFLQQ